MIKTLVIFGTRPEGIKLAPVIFALRENDDAFETKVCVTAQHRQMLDSVLRVFEIVPDYDCNIMREGQNLFDVTASALQNLEKILDAEQPQLVIVQGDTTTTFAASLAAFYKRIKVAHVESGLRTGNKFSPFPEEVNRRCTSVLADFHFAPTQKARQNLIDEGIVEKSIFVTGNTVIDALMLALKRVENDPPQIPELDGIDLTRKKLIVVTGHRRESFGEGFRNICLALKSIADQYRNSVEIVYPVHLNPNVQQPVCSILADIPNVHLIAPLDYLPFVKLIKDSYLILTDSGGIQEEAPALGKPVLVMRKTTERPEGIEAGVARLVGTEKDAIIEQTRKLLDSENEYAKMSTPNNPYGDGNAANLIVHTLKRILSA